MKRSEMARGRGFKPRTKEMARASKRRRTVEVEYRALRGALLGQGVPCEAQISGCDGRATQLHHLLSRGRSGRDSDLVSRENVVRLCDSCHQFIENHREWALANGWLKKARPMEEATQ